ncbi:hypothetical protein FQP90_17165 [Paenarthrobacter nitroguajacolicus]|uniref:Uncharacterized protein n=1 Tax=Paenarthrobacter nitroguajacolicus TaxID=211146 RepID=A0A558GTD2_PAENT|nr:hypothetical protein [Paenarthrobacter nitroguajacolicus]TVU60121.1 hypothetical protein FQP90_17165 [Paenarthrobacter nitroguajacolicus]
MSLYEVDIERTGRRRSVWRWFLLHPAADYLWAVLGVLLWLGIAMLARQPLMVEGADTDARRTLLQTLATLAGATAGLTLTSVSMLINVLGKKAAPGQRELPLERLSAAHRRQIGEVFLFAIPGLGLLVVAALVTIVLEGDAPTGLWIPEAVVFVLAFASVLALLRVAWALRRVLAIATA